MKGQSFLVNLGNSDTGVIGGCIRVTVPGVKATPEQAVEVVRKFLDEKLKAIEGIELGAGDVTGDMDRAGVEYCRVFINSANIRATMIGDGDIEAIDSVKS